LFAQPFFNRLPTTALLALFCRGPSHVPFVTTPYPHSTCPSFCPARNWVCLYNGSPAGYWLATTGYRLLALSRPPRPCLPPIFSLLPFRFSLFLFPFLLFTFVIILQTHARSCQGEIAKDANQPARPPAIAKRNESGLILFFHTSPTASRHLGGGSWGPFSALGQ
jgi:hypothetical protein